MEEAETVEVPSRLVEDAEEERQREKELVGVTLEDPVADNVGEWLTLVVIEGVVVEVVETLTEEEGVREGDKVEVRDALGHCEAVVENEGKGEPVRVTEGVLHSVDEEEGVERGLLERVLVAKPDDEIDGVGVADSVAHSVEEEECVSE